MRLLLFDLTADIVIVIMILQIFSGIIIDKFTSEREKLESMQDDQEQKCFICGIYHEMFETIPDYTFSPDHIKGDHYMWNYLFFMGYIEKKNKLDYDGTESYIANNLKKRNTSWFPINKAKILNIDGK